MYRVTPRGLEQQLMDACEESTRSVARSLQHLEVYGLRTDRSGKGAKIIKGVGNCMTWNVAGRDGASFCQKAR